MMILGHLAVQQLKVHQTWNLQLSLHNEAAASKGVPGAGSDERARHGRVPGAGQGAMR